MSSPLAVIALFIGLSEATVGAAAVGTDGASQLLLSAFAVIFPAVVFGVFVWMLLSHPAHLYSPEQYTEITSVEAYVGALRRDGLAAQAVLEQAIAVAVSTAFAEDGDHPTADPASVRASVSEAVDRAVNGGSVTLVRGQLIAGAHRVRFPVSEETQVQDLLDAMYFALNEAIEPHSYGRDWWLVGENGVGFPKMGALWARRNLDRPYDDRSLATVGIAPGAIDVCLTQSHRSRS